MTDVDGYGDAGSRGPRGESTRNWTTSSLAWTAKRGGKALGYSVRALRETGVLITGAHRATTETIKASGKALDALVASTAGRLSLQIPIGARSRRRKRIGRQQKQSAHLRQKMGLKIAAGLDAGDIDPTEDATVRNLAQAPPVRAVENAELRSKLELPGAGTEARAAPERTQGNAEPPEAGEPDVEGPDAKLSKTEEPGIQRVAAKPPKVEETPWTRAQIRFSLERTAEQAEFHLASEEHLFGEATKEVQRANPALVEAAIWNLRRIENPAATRILGLLAKDPRVNVRIQALNALTERGEEVAAPLFQHAIRDGSAGVRRAALRGLYRLAPGSAIPYLTEALRDSDAGVRHRAVMCLTWAGVRSVLPNLLPLLADPDALVRRAAVDALGSLKSKVSVPGLIQALDDQNARVRKAAHKTLMNLTRHRIVLDPDAPCEDSRWLKTQWEVWWDIAKATFQIDRGGS